MRHALYTRIFGLRLMAMVLAGCAGSVGDGHHDPTGDPGGSGGDTEPGWDCAQNDGAMECTSSADPDEHLDYLCTSGEAACPPQGSAPTDEWACVSGHGTVSCRQVLQEEIMPGMRPTDCSVAAWKTYFCQISDQVIASHGIDFALLCDELPNVIQPTLVSGACNDVVSEMELKSWTEAAYVGCAGALSGEITAWCHAGNVQLDQAGVCD